MEIRQAAEMGFCFGVRRALRLLERAVQERGPLESLGPVVHNRLVVARLAAQGVKVVDTLEAVGGSTVAITSHGVGPEVLAGIQRRGLNLVDATCPFVHRAQRVAQSFVRAGFYVLIFGEADHPEVRGVLGWAQGRGRASLSPPHQELSSVKRLGVLSQTTQGPDQFKRFVKELLESGLRQGTELRIVNTICDATIKRQGAALELARQVEVMLVVGGRGSANTRHLAEVATAAGVETHHIETTEELEASWVQGRQRVGITAGASTPDETILEVGQRLKELAKR